MAPGNDARHLSFKDLWVNQNSSTGLSSYCKTADRIYGVSYFNVACWWPRIRVTRTSTDKPRMDAPDASGKLPFS